ncbi:hypothetical protein GMB86_07120 [Terrilactibacillus sp. BCM23-1]|uniref:Uncharacterized protein n=1 Tax=Terrilactibacillus tamarindi TaxID=2599694 RepID=A0A6N8CNQ9_9BACI|nr:hypothetical protein [Terrilactibacillus tamarindi]MTT31784.1 hypothetical protein [Terrilactibacillus tamarindi]
MEYDVNYYVGDKCIGVNSVEAVSFEEAEKNLQIEGVITFTEDKGKEKVLTKIFLDKVTHIKITEKQTKSSGTVGF